MQSAKNGKRSITFSIMVMYFHLNLQFGSESRRALWNFSRESNQPDQKCDGEYLMSVSPALQSKPPRDYLPWIYWIPFLIIVSINIFWIVKKPMQIGLPFLKHEV